MSTKVGQSCIKCYCCEIRRSDSFVVISSQSVGDIRQKAILRLYLFRPVSLSTRLSFAGTLPQFHTFTLGSCPATPQSDLLPTQQRGVKGLAESHTSGDNEGGRSELFYFHSPDLLCCSGDERHILYVQRSGSHLAS